jgi:hypothetical protein
MANCTFPALVTLALVVDVLYFSWFVHAAYKHDMLWTTMQSCQMYAEVAKGVIIGAGIITSVLAAALESTSSIPHYLTGRTILFLAIAIFFSFITIMVLTRATETAIGRELRKPSGGDARLANGSLQGRLTWAEFLVEIACGFVALGAFLIGILYLGRIGYVFSQR